MTDKEDRSADHDHPRCTRCGRPASGPGLCAQCQKDIQDRER
jgi:hypothetical protein